MRKQWIVALGILFLVLASWGWAEAAAVNTCADNGGTKHIVDTAGEAAAIGANGYDNSSCNLVINTSITPITLATLTLNAMSIEITGPDVLVAGQSVEIINDNAASVVSLAATGGDLKIKDGDIRARNQLVITCTSAGCKIEVDDSTLIATLNLDTDPLGGNLRIRAKGDVRIENTTTFAGDTLHIRSDNGKVTWFCPGEGGCKLPSESSREKELCGDPPLYPCTVTFNSTKELNSVCKRGVKCGGPNKELGVRAKLDVDIRGSTITVGDHCTFTSEEENILAGKRNSNKANISCESIRMTAKKEIDVSDATLTAPIKIILNAGTGCPDPGLAFPDNVCIHANRSDIEGKEISMTANNGNGVIKVCDATLDDLGPDLPVLNGDSTPPYDPNVIDTAAECTAVGEGAPTIN